MIIVGEGYAGLACAAQSAKLGLKVATFEAEFFGGLVVNVNELEHFEEADGRSGLELAASLAAGNRKAGVKSIAEPVTSVVAVDGGFELMTDSGKHRSRFVVIASGARPISLNVPGESEFEGRGVSHCADCDAPMFSNANVIIAGAGNWAFKAALLLARESAKVHIVYQGLDLTASVEFVDRVNAEPKIRLHPGLEIQEVIGDANGMTAVRAVDSNGNNNEIQGRGLFVMVGLAANSTIAPAEVARNNQGFLEVGAGLESSVPGLWAIGQVRSGFGGWLTDAVADGKRAAENVKIRAG